MTDQDDKKRSGHSSLEMAEEMEEERVDKSRSECLGTEEEAGHETKELRVRLKLLNQRYEEDLRLFSEYRIEHVMKNSGAKEYLDRLRDKERSSNEIIASLNKELELSRKEAELWRSKCQIAEQQCSTYLRAWKDTQVKKEQLEAQKVAQEEKEMMSKSFNFSCASSLAEHSIPPPPPINVPTVEEILKMTNTTTTTTTTGHNNSSNSHLGAMNLSQSFFPASNPSSSFALHYPNNVTSSSIASPPPSFLAEFNGSNGYAMSQHHHHHHHHHHQTASTARSTSSTNNSGSGGPGFMGKNGTTGVGVSYGKVFNSRSGGPA